MIQDDCKQCRNCKEIFGLDAFFKSERQKGGFHYDCKKCDSKKRQAYREKNKEKVKLRRQKYYQKNLDKMRAEKVRYGRANKRKKREYDKKYRPCHKDKIKQYKKGWESKKKNDPIFKIKRNLRRRVHHALKGGRKADKTFNLIGCSPEFFKSYIASLWKENMNWENYGPKGWHIDHIVPCYKFDLTLEEEQRKCFHYSNQRPLWAWENTSRSRD
jgi:hypothetical protein